MLTEDDQSKAVHLVNSILLTAIRSRYLGRIAYRRMQKGDFGKKEVKKHEKRIKK